MIFEHIDKIARDKKRDVVFAVFHADMGDTSAISNLLSAIATQDLDWQDLTIRKQLIEMLDAEGIDWQPCGSIANENMMCGYYGQIYIDTPLAPSDPNYQKVLAYLETSDGKMRYPNVTFCVLQLSTAMENAHHDEPGFWQHWAEKF